MLWTRIIWAHPEACCVCRIDEHFRRNIHAQVSLQSKSHLQSRSHLQSSHNGIIRIIPRSCYFLKRRTHLPQSCQIQALGVGSEHQARRLADCNALILTPEIARSLWIWRALERMKASSARSTKLPRCYKYTVLRRWRRLRGWPPDVPMLNRQSTSNVPWDFFNPLLLLLWRTGDFPRSKGLIAIPNISLTRNVTDVWTSQVMVAWWHIDVGQSLQRLNSCRCSR